MWFGFITHVFGGKRQNWPRNFGNQEYANYGSGWFLTHLFGSFVNIYIVARKVMDLENVYFYLIEFPFLIIFLIQQQINDSSTLNSNQFDFGSYVKQNGDNSQYYRSDFNKNPIDLSSNKNHAKLGSPKVSSILVNAKIPLVMIAFEIRVLQPQEFFPLLDLDYHYLGIYFQTWPMMRRGLMAKPFFPNSINGPFGGGSKPP